MEHLVGVERQKPGHEIVKKLGVLSVAGACRWGVRWRS